MLSRIAHELFWLGRSVARAEHTARMLDGMFQASLQGRPDDPAGVTLDWPSLLAIMGAPAGAGPVRRSQVLHALTVERDNPASVVACIARARERARNVRDVISAEMWEAINTASLELTETKVAARLLSEPYSLFQDAKERCALFWGLTARTMLRDEASAFLNAGGRIESGDMMLRMLRVSLPPAGREGRSEGGSGPSGHALTLLQAVGGFQAFRRAVPAPPDAEPVTRFLLYETAYPDSVAASLNSAHKELHRADASPRNSPPVLRLQRLSADLEFRRRAEGEERGLRLVCEAAQEELALVDRDIAERYFAGAAAGRSVVAI